MIKFMTVQGKVIVSDKQNHIIARSGLELSGTGNYLIATNRRSSAQIMVGGKIIGLRASSFLRVRGDRTWWDTHSESWKKDAKLFIGRLWSRVNSDPRDPGSGNTAVGIRG